MRLIRFASTGISAPRALYAPLLLTVPLIASIFPGPLQAEPADSFYVPENPRYTIVASALDSLRFTVEKTVKPDEKGHLVSISSFVDPEARIMDWHDFGPLEGPGWAANAVGGAWEIYTFGRFVQNAEWKKKAVSVLDHVLEGGFIDASTGFIKGYRHTTRGEFCLNYRHGSEWFCPGSMAKIAFQLLLFSDELTEDPRGPRMREIARRCAEWIRKNVEDVPNGWFPRRTTPEGRVYMKSPTGGRDTYWQTSADGLFIVQLWTELTRRGAADYKEIVGAKTRVFMKAGGIFGSINHDTYDPHENVAYSVAFRTLRQVGKLLEDPEVIRFAHETCLAGLDQFKMREDRNGVATRGLLYMEKSWPTSYLWENAEAALALFEAAHDLRTKDPETSRRHELSGLTILRAAAKHHHGPYGFLTEGVDWSNHVGQEHHIGKKTYAAIRYTEPFLNNQHITEPTLFYLENLATVADKDGKRAWKDCEGNVLWSKPIDTGR